MHQHKAAGRKTTLDIQNYGCNGNLLCDHGAVERNRISSLQSHGKALKKECCLPGVFCDSGDTPANLLCELNGHLMPCTSCFYGKWVEDVCAGQFGVFVYLVLSYFVLCSCSVLLLLFNNYLLLISHFCTKQKTHNTYKVCISHTCRHTQYKTYIKNKWKKINKK